MTHPDTLQRAAFEAWAASKHIDTTRDGFGGYESRWTEGASEGWRAAQATTEPVAWMYDWYTDDGSGQSEEVKGWITRDYDEAHSPAMGCHNILPIYTSPPDHTSGMRLALEALQLVPALIQYQFTGDRDAMNALQNASNACEAAIAALEGMVNRV